MSIEIKEEINLSNSMEETYHQLKEHYEIFKKQNEIPYSFNEYLLRCGLVVVIDLILRNNGLNVPGGNA